MNGMKTTHNPVLQIFGIIFGALIAVVAVLLGAVLLSFIVGFIVLTGLLMYLRIWWAKRKIKKSPSVSRSENESTAELFDVKYTIVKEREVDNER